MERFCDRTRRKCKRALSGLWFYAGVLFFAVSLQSTLWAGGEVAPFEPPQDVESFRDVAGDLRCPTCTGLSVLESDAPFSVQIKNLVKDKMAEGSSKDEILEFFVSRYGPWILRAPPKQGFHAVAWILPLLLLFLGPFMVWFFVWRRNIVVNTEGLRPAAQLLEEMELELSRLRGPIKGGPH